MNSYYLGSTVWGDNPPYPISILYVIPGTTIGNFTANFAMLADDGVVFGVEYIRIKEYILHMNKRRESGLINQGEYEESLHQVGEEHGH